MANGNGDKNISTSGLKEKILLIFYQEYPNQKPSHDEVVDEVKEVLLKMGYYVSLLPVNQSIERITSGIKDTKPDLIFNLCETFRNSDKFESNVTALLEMTGVPVTGSTAGALFLSQDKHISKKIFDFHRVPYADFFVVRSGQTVSVPRGFAYPLFVKPAREDASIGIDENSVVYNDESLVKKVEELQKALKGEVLVEKFIDGREFYVTVLGNRDDLRVLEVVELDFSKWPEGKPKIFSHAAKNDYDSAENNSLEFCFGQELEKTLPKETQKKMGDIALKVFKALDAHDYARVDMRMDKDGKIYVLEANLNPHLSSGCLVYMAAQNSGLSYEELMEKILRAALKRARGK